ncbi:MAG: RNA polymerase sigma factor [Candidatus Kapabacteria bacterium]|nr:RNA polymerase sigma factor [Ignavibacteriota bacterium]MCW5885985.1 RNA polymerase sigma factor [Candidatus Kapabacteria bacterium]
MKVNYDKYSDSELVSLLGEDRETASEAFKAIYDRYSPVVHSYCIKVLGYEETAEDVFQETFIKFFNNYSRESDRFNIQGYLLTIARNLCLNVKRDKKETVSDDYLDVLYSEEQSYEQKELLGLINRTIELLDEEHREAFVLREYSGLEYSEIAELCKTSVSNAKSRVFRAKQKIKKILEPYLKELSQ